MIRVTSDAYNGKLLELGFDVDPPLDDELICPSAEWLDQFGVYLFRRRPFYRTQSFDCDNFSAWASVLATEALLRADLKDADHSVIRAYFRNNKTVHGIPEGNHAANVVWLDDGRVVLFEPQNGKWSDLAGLVADGSVTPYRVRW